MKKQLLIIKLGGSVITYKNSATPKPRIKVIKRLAKELRQVLDTKKYHLIIGHGAGSLGHPLVKKHGLHLGMNTPGQKLAYGLVTQSMIKLNSLVIAALLDQNIPAVTLPPHSFTIQNDKKLQPFSLEIIQSYIQQNLVPVLFGDGVLDEKLGCSILSGDVIVPYLASQLKADKIIYLSDVDGIFDADPKQNPQAKLIPKINNDNLQLILEGLTTNNANDVTGEMQGKIKSIQQNLSNTEVIITNGFIDKSLALSVQGKLIGTKQHLSSLKSPQ